jgi:hypothetical protein
MACTTPLAGATRGAAPAGSWKVRDKRFGPSSPNCSRESEDSSATASVAELPGPLSVGSSTRCPSAMKAWRTARSAGARDGARKGATPPEITAAGSVFDSSVTWGTENMSISIHSAVAACDSEGRAGHSGGTLVSTVASAAPCATTAARKARKNGSTRATTVQF